MGGHFGAVEVFGGEVLELQDAIKAPLNDRTFVVQVLVFLSMPEFQRPQECSISISCAENVHDLVLQEILLVCVVDKADDAQKCSEPDCLRSRFR